MVNKKLPIHEIPPSAHCVVAENRQTFATSVAVKMFLDKHDLEREGATNLCTNIFKNKGDLEKIKKEVESYHLVYTHPNLYVGATHCLAKMACMFCSEPPDSVVEYGERD